MDREKVIKGLEETKIMLKQAVDRGGEMAVMGAFKCYNHVSDAVALLKEQKQKTGHWTTKRTLQHDGEWYCDQCEYEPIVFENTPFCPNCGAKMEGR